MLTDDEARTLLHRAADTIEVGPGGPLPTAAPRPRWPLLVAAALVLAIALGSVVLTRGYDGSPAPSSPPSGEPVEKPEVLDPDQIPSVLGYDLDEATEVLVEKGLRVVVRKQREPCLPPGIVTGTEPTLGARFEPGDTVSVFLSGPSAAGVSCLAGMTQAWDLLRFARGVAGPPEIAEDLTLYVEGEDPVSITREEAAAPDAWTVCEGECHSALAAIEQMATRTWTMNGGHYWGRPYLTSSDPSRCDTHAAVPELERTHTRELWITVPMDGIEICPAPSLLLHLDGAHRIRGVGLNLPEVRGLPPEPTPTQRRVADAFLAWARGDQTPPPFTDEVELLLADDPWETVTAAEASDRDRWSMCSGVPPETCAVNPLGVIDEFAQKIYPSRTLTSCGAPDPRHLPDHLAEAVDQELVGLSEAEPKNCEVYFTVELWITEDGRIHAVNFLP